MIKGGKLQFIVVFLFEDQINNSPGASCWPKGFMKPTQEPGGGGVKMCPLTLIIISCNIFIKLLLLPIPDFGCFHVLLTFHQMCQKSSLT